MVRSMTGYGRAEEIIDERQISVEVRSVNHRFFDFTAKIPREYVFLEEKLKSFFKSKVERGKIEVYVSIGKTNSDEINISVNHSLAKSYIDAINEISEKYGLASGASASFVAKLPDVLEISGTEIDEEKITADVLSVAKKALEIFIKMREDEGERMKADVESRLDFILNEVAFIEEQSPRTVDAYKERLESKIREVLDGKDIDENRILTEVAIFADKVAVNEETVRLKSHITAMKELLAGNDAVGKKMDFIVQEMNREANTTGSKCLDTEITRHVVAIKSEIEKIREQIQNIE